MTVITSLNGEITNVEFILVLFLDPYKRFGKINTIFCSVVGILGFCFTRRCFQYYYKGTKVNLQIPKSPT